MLRLSAVVLALLVAGCASPALDPAGGDPASPEEIPTNPADRVDPQAPRQPGNGTKPQQPPPSSSNTTPPKDDAPTFCESESGCKFWDDDYHEYTLYEVDSLHLDVLIVPSASPGLSGDTAVTKKAIEAWYAGIQALGAPWFAQNLTMAIYVVGTDTIPDSARDDPEIIVLSAEYNPVLLFGIGYQLPDSPCRGQAVRAYPAHEHGGLRVLAAECAQGGYTCLAVNTNNLGGGRYSLYDLVAHEVGHCLGGGHVGDALDFRAKRVPIADIMSYQSDEAQVHCVSSLNLRVLEALYAPLAGVEVKDSLRPGDFYTMPRADYVQVACENP